MKIQINIKLKENRWLLMAIVIGSFFNSFMSSSLNIAMPVIDNEYHVGLAKVAWISESFLLASAVGLMLAGWLADQFGRRKTFLFGNLIFGFISLFIYDWLTLKKIHWISWTGCIWFYIVWTISILS